MQRQVFRAQVGYYKGGLLIKNLNLAIGIYYFISIQFISIQLPKQPIELQANNTNNIGIYLIKFLLLIIVIFPLLKYRRRFCIYLILLLSKRLLISLSITISSYNPLGIKVVVAALQKLTSFYRQRTLIKDNQGTRLLLIRL